MSTAGWLEQHLEKLSDGLRSLRYDAPLLQAWGQTLAELLPAGHRLPVAGNGGSAAAAGTDACGPLSEVDVDTWERVVKVNLFGTAALVRACLPYLTRSRGTVVTVSSTLGLKAVGDATAYCASTFAVVGFTRALATELAGQVGVTLLIPGGMRTAFFDGRTEQYRPGPDAVLNDPADTAEVVLTALRQPVGCEIRELVVATSTEPSWP